MMNHKKKKGKTISNRGILITYHDPRSPATEAYRTLRTNIQFASLDKPHKTMVITSPNPACGKSITAANIAVTLAQSGAGVLLVDTDLRRPTLHNVFGVLNEGGLTNFLRDVTMDLGKVVVSTGVEKLQLLTSGPIPPNPAELLSTETMKNAVELFRQKYDYVIFDSPPVIAVTDAAILSRLVDATILVIAYGQVTYDEAIFTQDQLNKVQANIIGAVINGVSSNKSGYYYYYGDRKSRRSIRKHGGEGMEKYPLGRPDIPI